MSSGSFPPTPRRVLIVDDDPIVCLLHQELVEEQGHEVSTASSVATAVQQTAEVRPHLLLLDYQLPDGTGADVVRRIRRAGSLAHVIFVSGHGETLPIRQMLADLDVHGFFRKGDPQLSLLLLVDSALRHYDSLYRLRRQRAFVERVSEAARATGELQPLPQLLESALHHLSGLLESAGESPNHELSGLLVSKQDDQPAVIRASLRAATVSGRPGRSFVGLEAFPPAVGRAARRGMTSETPTWTEGFVVLPVKMEGNGRACMLMRCPPPASDVNDALELFARQMSQAISNNLLFERATVDALTRVINRGFGLQRLAEVLALGSRGNETTSILLIDLDHFKVLNDTHGHAAGDEALRQAAKVFQETCRTSDVVCRYGGEEFLVVLPTSDAEGAMHTALRILEALRNTKITVGKQRLQVTASIGIATARPGERSVDDLLKRADDALYRAKESGRDRAISSQMPPQLSPVIRFYWDFFGADAAQTAEHHRVHVAEFFQANDVPFEVGKVTTGKDRSGVAVFFESDRFPEALIPHLDEAQLEAHERGSSPPGLVDDVGRALRPARYELLV